MFKASRSVEENVLLFISALVVVAVSPFVVIRFLDGDYGLALWNTILTTTMGCLFVYVYRTRKVKIPGVCLSLAFLIGSTLTVHLKGSGQIYWVFPAFVGTFYMMNPRGALALCICSFILILPVIVPTLDTTTLAIAIISLFINIVFAFVFALMTRNQRDRLLVLSRTDPLTGIFNRRVMNERVASVYGIFQRSDLPVSALLIDIDHFKSINDNYGHYIGDSILVKLTKILTEHIRVSDTLFRYGGEEFVIIAENTEAHEALILAEKLRKVIENSTMAEGIEITVSIGVAQLQKDELKQQWISRADHELLKAKKEGRNRVCTASTT